MGEDSKFGFSERTNVDKGATGETPPPPTSPEPEENLEATAAISLADIGKIDLGAPAPPTVAIPAPPPVEVDSGLPDLDEVEKTGAMSLDALRAAGLLDEDDKIVASPTLVAPEPPKAAEEEEIPPEATAMLTAPIQDYLPKPSDADAFDDEPQATMMLQSPLDGGPPPPAAAPEPPPEEPAKAQIQAGNDRGRTFDLTQDEYLVGRGLNCDIVLNDASVSRKHFKFRRVDGQWQLHDLGSGNGTKVNGDRVDVIDLFHGSVIDAGTTSVLWDHPGHLPPAAMSAEAVAAAPVVDDEEPIEATMALSAIDPAMLPPGAGSAGQFKDIGGSEDRDDSTRVGDMASLEVLADWDPKQAVADAQASADLSPGGSPPPKKKKKKKGKKGLLLVALLLLLVGGFLLADRFAQLGIVFPVAAEVAPETADSEGDGDGDTDGTGEGETGETEDQKQAKALMAEGLTAFKGKLWLQARKAFKKAIKLDAEVAGGKAGLEQAKAELAAQRDLENADKALEEESFEEALGLAKKVGDTSSYYPDAQKVQKSAVDGLVGKALTKARELEDSDLPGAMKVVEAALALAKDDPELLGLRGDLKSAMESDTADADGDASDSDVTEDAGAEVVADVGPDVAPDAAEEVAADVVADTDADTANDVDANDGGGPPTVAAADTNAGTSAAAVVADAGSSDAAGDADADTSAPAVAAVKPTPSPRPSTSNKPRRPSKPRASSGGTAKKISSALSSYGSGNFSGAASALKAVASSRAKKKDRAKASRLAKNIDKFKGYYATGMSAAKGFKAGSAISNLSKARKLDAGISGAYQGRIKKSLAKMYAYRANAAHSSGNLGVAGSNARKALAFDPSLSAAKRIYTEVQAKAQGWFDSAKASAKSNPDKAISLLQKVIKVLPRTDSRYKSAYALLNKLAEDDGE